MTKRDLRYIRDVLQKKPPGQNMPDWYSVLGFIELHKLCGVFLNNANEIKTVLPQAVEKRLQSILRLQIARNGAMKKWAEDISEELKYEKIPHAFLKGSILSNCNLRYFDAARQCAMLPHALLRLAMERNQTFYSPGERVSNDVDILALPSDISRIDKVLKEMGFVQGYWSAEADDVVVLSRSEILSRRMNRGETAPYIKKLGSPELPFIEVDVNFSLDYLPAGNRDLLSEMIASAGKYEPALGKGIYSLRPELFLTHLVLHQYKEMRLYSMVLRRKDLELYKLYDIFIFFKYRYADINALKEIIAAHSLQKEVAVVLSAVLAVFDDLSDASHAAKLLEHIAAEKGDEAFNVLDPENKNKAYAWKTDVLTRLIRYSPARYLEEIK
ncbi:MAG: nucleotidyltransferase family protein [Christensenellales bacterium]